MDFRNPKTYGAIAIAVFIAWTAIYNIGKPWNCQQASSEVAKEQAWADEAMKSGNMSAYMGALSNVRKAESNEVRLCRQR